LLIDPQDAGINEKAGVCRKSIPARHAPPQAARTGEGRPEQEDRVKRLIEGGESN
jgi:hypothetical protein